MKQRYCLELPGFDPKSLQVEPKSNLQASTLLEHTVPRTYLTNLELID